MGPTSLRPGAERVRHRVVTVIAGCRRPAFDIASPPAGSPGRLTGMTVRHRRKENVCNGSAG
jgi:hypothetical protein